MKTEETTFVVEGRRAVAAVLDGPLPIQALIILRSTKGEARAARGADLEDRAIRRGIEVRHVDEHNAHRYFTTRSPQGIAALVERPVARLLDELVSASRRLVVLDGVSDPGNAGTLVRTAWLCGWDAVLATSGGAGGAGSVDLYSEKVARASAGALVFLPLLRIPASEIAAAMARSGYRMLVASPRVSARPDGKKPKTAHATIVSPSSKSDASSDKASSDDKICLILGNEAHGAISEWPGAHPVSIATRRGPIDSLGVVASGAVLLHRYGMIEAD